MMSKIFRTVLYFIVAFYSFIVLVLALHWGLNVCPFHLKTFKKPLPVVYGLPTIDMFLKAKSGESILGGCMVHSLSALCPYCHLPAGFTFNRTRKEEPTDNDETGR